MHVLIKDRPQQHQLEQQINLVVKMQSYGESSELWFSEEWKLTKLTETNKMYNILATFCNNTS